METIQTNNQIVTIKGLYDQTMLDLVKYVLDNKVKIKRDLTIEFAPTTRIDNRCGGYYSARENLVKIAATDVYSCVLSAITHELRHVEQDHYGFMHSRKNNSKDEKDALKYQLLWKNEFIAHQKQLGTFEERPILYRLGCENFPKIKTT